MIKATIQLLIVAVSIAIFIMFTKVQNTDRQNFIAASKDLDTALSNYQDYSAKKDAILAQKAAINPDDMIKLEKILPKNVENMKLILDIVQIAKDNKMVIRNFKFDSDKVKSGASDNNTQTSDNESRELYNKFNVQFSSEGKYSDFVSFLTQLEKNQRIVDSDAITFTANDVTVLNTPPDYYKYDVSINTYWLGNNQ